MISTSHISRRNNRKSSRLGLELLEDRRLLSADSWVAPSGFSNMGSPSSAARAQHMIEVDEAGAVYVAEETGQDWPEVDILVRKYSPETNCQANACAA
jgi:hypothetical protein